MKLKITKIDYHRNGVAGNGFHVVLFTWRNRNMVATVFEGAGNCAVLDMYETAMGHLEYPENRWRGDDFEPQLRAAIAASYPEVSV